MFHRVSKLNLASPIAHSSPVISLLDMSQNPTTVAVPFTLPPLRQHTPANRLKTDLQASSMPSDLSPSPLVPALSISVPNTHSSDSKLNIEALTQLGLNLLNEPSSPTAPHQGPPELDQAAANNAAYRMRHLSGSSPPAYRPNNE